MFRNTKNLSDKDRIIRMGFGLFLLLAALSGLLVDSFKTIVIILATYLVVTGVIAYCPVNEVLSNSNKRSVSHRSHNRRRHR